MQMLTSSLTHSVWNSYRFSDLKKMLRIIDYISENENILPATHVNPWSYGVQKANCNYMSVAWKFIIQLLKSSYAFNPSEMLPHKIGHKKKQNNLS